jgi:hypothetical protein
VNERRAGSAAETGRGLRCVGDIAKEGCNVALELADVADHGVRVTQEGAKRPEQRSDFAEDPV